MANKSLDIIVNVDSSKLDATTKKLGQLKDFGKGLKIQYDIDGKPLDVVLDKSLNLQKQVRVLTAELRRTKEGTDEFALLNSKLNDAKDNLERVSVKTRDLFAAVSLLPGPVGNFFGQLNGVIGLMKTFSGFSLKDIGNQFKELKNDIFDIYKNLFGVKQAADELSNSNSNLSNTTKETNTTINATSTSLKSAKEAMIGYVDANGKAISSTKDFDKSSAQVIDRMENMRTAGKGVNKEVSDVFKTFDAATKAGVLLGRTMVGVGISFETAAVAVGIFETALAAVGIGLVIAGLSFLIDKLVEGVKWLWKFKDGTLDAEAATKSLTKALDELEISADKSNKAIKRSNEERIALMKAQGATEKQIREETVKNMIKERDNTSKTLGETVEILKKLQANRGKNDEENNKQIERALKKKRDLEETYKDQSSAIRVAELNNVTTTNKEIADAGKKRAEDYKKVRDKEIEDAKTANQTLLDLQKENTLAALSNERDRQYKELELQAAAEVDKINALKISEAKKEEIRNQIFLKYSKKQIALSEKFNKEDIDKAKELADKKASFESKLEQYRIDAIANANLKEKEERQKKYDDELKDLDKALKDKLISQDQYNTALKNLQLALENDLKKIDDDAKKKANEDKLKKLDDDIKILQIQVDAEKNTWVAYWEDRQKLLNAAKERELAETDISEEKKHAIEKKYVQLSKDLQKEKFNAMLGYINAGLGAFSNAISQQQQINSIAQQNELDAAKGNAAEQDKIKEKYFYKNRDAQVGQAIISTLQSAVSAYSSLAVIPIVGPALGAVAAAAALVFGYKQVNAIKAQKYQGASAESGGGASTPAANYGKNYGDGGMIDGPRHAQGGVAINAEGGEAVMTRGAVTMFRPLLSMMNQAGGGTSFMPNLTTTSYDAPNIKNPAEDNKPMVIKSYVVSSELTSEQQRQARLKDLSTL